MISGNISLPKHTHVKLDLGVVGGVLVDVPVVGGNGQEFPLPIVHEFPFIVGDVLAAPPQGQVNFFHCANTRQSQSVKDDFNVCARLSGECSQLCRSWTTIEGGFSPAIKLTGRLTAGF